MKNKILLVEDEPHLSFMLQYNLQHEGYSVATISNGGLAIEAFKKLGPFDLVILDVMLPEKSGFHVMETLRKIDEDVPVIFLTARSLEEDRIRGLKLGADDYLTKPFSLEEFLLRVKRLLVRKKTYDDNLYQFDNFILDHHSYELQTPQGTKKLTPFESELLSLFLKNKGKVLTREFLMSVIGKSEENFELRSIDNLVMRLRKHIEEDTSNPQRIKSVRGKGYQFVGI